jgi:hypothetical protein
VVLLDLIFSILRKVSACPRAPNVVLFRRAKFLLEALFQYVITTIYYFLVYKMGMPHYNLKYNYWKRCSISRHHITAQTFCIPLIGSIPGLVALFQYIITADYPFRNETKSEWSRQQIDNRGNNVPNGKRRWRQLWGSRTCHNYVFCTELPDLPMYLSMAHGFNVWNALILVYRFK